MKINGKYDNSIPKGNVKRFSKTRHKAHKKYTRTKKQLNFEDKYAKPMFQAGVKHNNENLKVISGNMQESSIHLG